MLLRDRSFRRYVVGQTLSAFGGALSTIALAFAVLSLSSSAAALGLVMAASRLPQILFALLGGALGDRYSRRVILLGTDAVRCGLQALTATLLILHAADLVVLVLLQSGAGLCAAVFAPAANGLISHLAPEGHNREATALLSLSRNTAGLAGLALSGGLVAGLGPGPAFAVDAATFAASTLSLALIRCRPMGEPPGGRTGLLADVADGWRAVRRLPWLLTHCVYVCLLNALALSPFFVLGPVVAERHFGGASAWAAIAVAWAVGAIAGGACATRWRPRHPIAAAIAVSTCLVPILLALAVALPLALVFGAAAMAGWEGAVANCLVMVALQDHVPDHLLARATSFESIGALVAVPLGMSFTGLVADWTSPGVVLGFAAGWVLLSSLLALAVPAVRAIT